MKHSWRCADVWRLHCGAAFYAKTVNKDRAFISVWLLPAEQVRNGTRSVLVILSICINLCIVNSSFTVWLTMSSVLHSEATRRKTFSRNHLNCDSYDRVLARSSLKRFLAAPAHSLTACPAQISGSVAHWRRSKVHHRGKSVRMGLTLSDVNIKKQPLCWKHRHRGLAKLKSGMVFDFYRPIQGQFWSHLVHLKIQHVSLTRSEEVH